MRNKIIGILIIVLVIAVMRVYPKLNKKENIITETQSQCTTFIQDNINHLSPTAPVLGGTRYTTHIEYMT